MNKKRRKSRQKKGTAINKENGRQKKQGTGTDIQKEIQVGKDTKVRERDRLKRNSSRNFRHERKMIEISWERHKLGIYIDSKKTGEKVKQTAVIERHAVRYMERDNTS